MIRYKEYYRIVARYKLPAYATKMESKLNEVGVGNKRKLFKFSYNYYNDKIKEECGMEYSTHSLRRASAIRLTKEYSLETTCYICGWAEVHSLLMYLGENFGVEERIEYEKRFGNLGAYV